MLGMQNIPMRHISYSKHTRIFTRNNYRHRVEVFAEDLECLGYNICPRPGLIRQHPKTFGIVGLAIVVEMNVNKKGRANHTLHFPPRQKEERLFIFFSERTHRQRGLFFCFRITRTFISFRFVSFRLFSFLFFRLLAVRRQTTINHPPCCCSDDSY